MAQVAKVCKREGCDNTFTTFPSSNKRFCSPPCRYSDPDVADLMSKSISRRHNLSNIDEDTRTADCDVCGHIDIRKRTDKRIHATTTRWRCRGAERARVWARQYGLSTDDIFSMLEGQNGLCAICFKDVRNSFHVDHCHTTDVVRGLLCSQCNTGIGLLQEDTEVLQRAINYLELVNASSED